MSNQQYPPLKLSAEQAKETPMVDLAFLVLKSANTPFYYRDLMTEIAKYKGYTEGQIRDVIAQLYTEINVDGRFACVGNNLWGLKRWYPVDTKEDAVGGKHPRIINDEEDDDEEDVFQEEEETFTSEEDFDSFDEDREEVTEEEEEEEFFPEEELDESEEEVEEDIEGDEDSQDDDDLDDDLASDSDDEDDK